MLRRDLPEESRRLFTDPGEADPVAGESLVIGRLLEDGDGGDLAWLFTTYGEEGVRGWFTARGGRRLSRRSRALWRLVLGIEAGPGAAIHDDLWPL